MLKTDVVVIGAGAVGCAIARELSKYKIDVTVVDKNEDVGGDASKSNSAIIHTGYDASPGTLESSLVVAANPMYDSITEDLDVPFKRIGAILPAITDEQFGKLPAIKEKAFNNRVYDVEFKTGKELLLMEPNLNPEVKGGLWIPRESIIDPFILVQAMAENAYENGVRFLLETKVTAINTENGKIKSVVTIYKTIAVALTKQLKAVFSFLYHIIREVFKRIYPRAVFCDFKVDMVARRNAGRTDKPYYVALTHRVADGDEPF